MLNAAYNGNEHHMLVSAFSVPLNMAANEGFALPMMLSALSCSDTYNLLTLGESFRTLPPLLTQIQGNPVDLEGACGPQVWDLINITAADGAHRAGMKEFAWLQAGLADEMFSIKKQYTDMPVVVPKGLLWRDPKVERIFEVAWTGPTSFHDLTAEEAVDLLEKWHTERGSKDENWNKGLRLTIAVAFRAAVIQAHLSLCFSQEMMGLQLSRWASGFVEGCNQRLSPHLSRDKGLPGGCHWFVIER